MLKEIQNVFIVGIKGVAMANIALILKKMGKNVSGSDVEEEFITDKLLKESGIHFTAGFNVSDIPSETELVAYSAAHGRGDNPQIVEAKKRGLMLVHQARLIAEIMKPFKTKIAVCGSHGKTTSSSLLAYVFSQLGVKPSYLVGVPYFGRMPGGDYQKGDYFVVEADEYAVNPPEDKTPKLNFLNPDYILATNIDLDHPDVYRDLGEIKAAFLKFFDGKSVIACVDDTNLMEVMKKVGQSSETFGFGAAATLRISNTRATENETHFVLSYKKSDLGEFVIPLFGKKNISNAAGVILMFLQLGFDAPKIKNAIAGFSGVKRRFELKSYENDTYLFDDYAHHPREIETTIAAARARFPKRRIIIIFQPHTYSRTKKLLKDFTLSLAKADLSLIAPIFPSAREKEEEFTISSHDIAVIDNLRAFSSIQDLADDLKTTLQKGDVIFTMGAGDIYKLENDIIRVVQNIV